MDASAALERLRDISSQVREAVVFDRGGKVLGTTLRDESRAGEVAREARELLDAGEARNSSGEFAQLEVALQRGSVFVVRDGETLIAATTAPEPTVGLVFYDLKSCLRGLGEEEAATKPKPKPRPRAPRKKKADETA